MHLMSIKIHFGNMVHIDAINKIITIDYQNKYRIKVHTKEKKRKNWVEHRRSTNTQRLDNKINIIRLIKPAIQFTSC